MEQISFVSQITFYVLLGLIGLYCLLVVRWQIMVLRGKAMNNPDGSTDDWHEQKTHYGIAFADVFVTGPVTIAGIVLVFLSPRWGHYLLSLVSFWFVWSNIMTTATSLRFENPKINLDWFITFPFGIIVGLLYIAWSIAHFDRIYFPL